MLPMNSGCTLQVGFELGMCRARVGQCYRLSFQDGSARHLASSVGDNSHTMDRYRYSYRYTIFASMCMSYIIVSLYDFHLE